MDGKQEISGFGGQGRRSAADEVFQHLQSDIDAMRLPPGSKLSEVEVAKRLDVSRQPVREAFIRLHDMKLLEVRPQRATEVRRFSRESILEARFIRTAVETEVLRVACSTDTSAWHARFERNLGRQRKAIDAGRIERFHELDYEFHELICRAAGRAFAWVTIAEHRAQSDRLCFLSLETPGEFEVVLDEHHQIFAAIRERRTRRSMDLLRRHLARVDSVIEAAMQEHPDYFLAD